MYEEKDSEEKNPDTTKKEKKMVRYFLSGKNRLRVIQA
jgi:hypothetical protein